MKPTFQQPIFIAQQGSRAKCGPLRALGLLMAVMVLTCAGSGIGSLQDLRAQQPSQTFVSATTLFETQLQNLPPGPVMVSVATIALAPGQATVPLEGHGSLLILVESGTVNLQMNHAIDGPPAINSDDGSGARVEYVLREGQRVTLSAIGTIRFHNEGDETSRLLFISLIPGGERL